MWACYVHSSTRSATCGYVEACARSSCAHVALTQVLPPQKTARADGLLSTAEHKRMSALERRAVIAEEKLDRERQRFEEAEAGRKLALKDANALREV